MAPPKQSRVNAERRARVEEMRREQQRRERRVRIVIGGVGGVVALGIVGVIVVAVLHNKSAVGEQVLPSSVSQDAAVTTEDPATKVPNTTGITGVVAYDASGHVPTAQTDDGHGLPFAHVDGPVTYSVTPPVGGNHNSMWMNCGVYNSPVPTERAVHDLEHGAIWITYEPSLPASQVKTLTSFVARQSEVTETIQGQKVPTGQRYMDLTPWKDASIGSPIVISAWGFQLKVTSPTDPRLQQFVDKFRTSTTYTPEYGASCNGTDPSVGGNPISS